MLTEAEWNVIFLSVRVASIAVLCSLPFAISVAYLLARRRGAVSFIADNFVLLPLVVPPVVTGYVLLVILGPAGVVGSLLRDWFGVEIAFNAAGAMLAAGVVSFPLLVQTIRVAIEQVDPEWEEAALVYGGNAWSVFRYVTLPLTSRGIAAGTVIAFARALGEFGATIVIAGNIPGKTRTIPLAIFSEINRIGGEEQALRLVLMGIAISLLSLFIHAWLVRRFH